MRTFDNYGRNDTVPFTDGDNKWGGIDMTRDYPLIAPGMLRRGENTRLRTGQVKQRSGTTIPPDLNLTQGFSNIIVGSGVYRAPNSDEVLMIAPALEKYVWVMQDGKDPYQVNYNAVETASGRTNSTGFIEFTQAFDKLLLHRIPMQGGKILVWNGIADQTSDTNKWTPLVKPAGAYAEVGAYYNGEPFMDRVIYYYWHWPTIPGRDEWIVSDPFEYAGYDNAFSDYRTNSSESDYITRIMTYFRGSVIIFKNQSIHQATVQYDFNLLRLVANQRVLNSSIGSVGNHMPLLVGEDIMFLSKPTGFFRLREIIQEQTVALAMPFSEPIQRVIDSINWGVTEIFGCSAALDNYAFFGVCLGGGPASRLNAILVFNTQSNQWESAGDTWADPGFSFTRLHVTNYQGVHRLFAIDRDNAIVYLLYEGVTDDMHGGVFSVPFVCETRGYVGDDPIGFKQFGRVSCAISTSDPNVTVTSLVDGYAEEKQLTTITKNRLRYYQHGKADFNVLTDDPDARGRESYGNPDGDRFVAEDFESLPVGPIAFLPPTGSPVRGNMQESLERNTIRQSGRWVSLRFENTEGVMDLLAVSVEGAHSNNTVRVVA